MGAEENLEITFRRAACSRIPFDTFNHHPSVYHEIAIDSGRNTVSSRQD